MRSDRRLKLLLVEPNAVDASALIQLMRTTLEDPLVAHVADFPAAQRHLLDHPIDAVLLSGADADSCRALVTKAEGMPVIALCRHWEAKESFFEAGARLAFSREPLLVQYAELIIEAARRLRPTRSPPEPPARRRRLLGLPRLRWAD